MRMPIDEVINELTSLIDCGILPISYEKYGKPFVTKESIEVAIDIMRKYQTIEDIYYHQTGRALEDSLRSVIEDGKIDTYE